MEKGIRPCNNADTCGSHLFSTYECVRGLLKCYVPRKKTNKRKPIPDGTLELTEEEKKEFAKMLGFEFQSLQKTADGFIIAKKRNSGIVHTVINKVSEILWLAERFNLEVTK